MDWTELKPFVGYSELFYEVEGRSWSQGIDQSKDFDNIFDLESAAADRIAAKLRELIVESDE